MKYFSNFWERDLKYSSKASKFFFSMGVSRAPRKAAPILRVEVPSWKGYQLRHVASLACLKVTTGAKRDSETFEPKQISEGESPERLVSREPRPLARSQATGVGRYKLEIRTIPISGVTDIGEYVEIGD